MSNTHETMLLISQAVRSKLPLSEAIRLSIMDTHSWKHKALLRFADELEKGLELPAAARKAGLSRKLSQNLEAALKSGDFPDYFAELTEAEYSRTKTLQNLTQMFSYPLFLGLAMALSLCLFVVVGPQFERIFVDFGTVLPPFTLFFLTVARYLGLPAFWAMLGVTAVILLLLQRLIFPTFWFYIPVLGRVLWTLSSEKLLRQLRISLRNHVPLDEAFRTAARSFRLNWQLRRQCRQAAALAAEGTKMSLIVSLFPLLFPKWLLPLIRMAETNDTIPDTLSYGIEILDEDRNGATLMVGTAIVPLTCFGFLFFAGLFVVAMFMPLIKLITTLSG